MEFNYLALLGTQIACKADLIRRLFDVGDERIFEIHVASKLKTEFKLLHSLCLFNLVPHTGSKDKVLDNDLLIMHYLTCPPSAENRLNLAHIIINHMIITSNSRYKNFTVPYDMLLTKVFEHFKVDLSNEHCEYLVKTFGLNNVKHMKINKVYIESPEVAADVPEPKRKRTEENLNEMLHEFNVSQNVPKSPPPVTCTFDLNQFLNFDIFFPDFSLTRNAATILEGMFSHKNDTTKDSPMHSSSSLFSSKFLNNLLKTPAPSFASTAPKVNFDTSLHSFNFNFGSFESFTSIGASLKPPLTQPYFAAENSHPAPPTAVATKASSNTQSSPTLSMLLEHVQTLQTMVSYRIFDYAKFHKWMAEE
jgi:hypothetical protein